MQSLRSATLYAQVIKPSSVSQLHTTTRCSASILFQLQGLSNSREGQWLSKASGLPRQEYSAALQLIKSSEVDPFNKPLRPAAQIPRRAPSAYQPSTIKLSVADFKALSIGRRIIASHNREVDGLKRQLSRLQRVHRTEKEFSLAENKKLKLENRNATVGILVAVAVATGLASWRFTPGKAKPDNAKINSSTTKSLSDATSALPAAVDPEVLPVQLISSTAGQIPNNRSSSWFWSS